MAHEGCIHLEVIVSVVKTKHLDSGFMIEILFSHGWEGLRSQHVPSSQPHLGKTFSNITILGSVVSKCLERRHAPVASDTSVGVRLILASNCSSKLETGETNNGEYVEKLHFDLNFAEQFW